MVHMAFRKGPNFSDPGGVTCFFLVDTLYLGSGTYRDFLFFSFLFERFSS